MLESLGAFGTVTESCEALTIFWEGFRDIVIVWER